MPDQGLSKYFLFVPDPLLLEAVILIILMMQITKRSSPYCRDSMETYHLHQANGHAVPSNITYVLTPQWQELACFLAKRDQNFSTRILLQSRESLATSQVILRATA